MKIGIDIGGSHIGIGVLDDNNNIITKIEKDIVKTHDIKNKIINYIDENIENIIKTSIINRFCNMYGFKEKNYLDKNNYNVNHKYLEKTFKVLKKQIEEKTKYLNVLIDEQNFEEAAIVRDEIKALKDESWVERNE